MGIGDFYADAGQHIEALFRYFSIVSIRCMNRDRIERNIQDALECLGWKDN